LIYVALIESGFTINARSHAQAVGMWQIVSATGTRFGLEQNEWVDQRRDPMKAAQAAADYLSLLYDKFGSWSLALAAYNAGENAVRGALEKSGLNTFWDLMENGFLPAETRDYVPKVFAAVKIIRNPDLYGFRVDEENFAARHETVSVPGGLKLSWVGKQIGVSQKLLRNYNPELCKPTTPPTCLKYELCLPVGTRDDLCAALARYPQHEEKVSKAETKVHKEDVPASRGSFGNALQKPVHYLVRPGDTLWSIAGKFHVPIRTLCAQNKVSPRQNLAPGNILAICTSRQDPPQPLKKKVN